MLDAAFLARMKDLLGDGLSDYLAAMERPPVRGLRLNPLKGERPADARLLAGAGLSLSPVAWEEGAFVFAGAEHIGASPLHHAGAFYIQEPSAMLPVACLPLSPGMRVLDLCAAPGGKSAQLAARIGETGLLVSNEIDRRRCDVLISNLERMGARNAVVTNTDAATLAGAMPDYFDAVVVDAPCSGEGMFRKEPQAVADWSPQASEACGARQRLILSHAAVAVRPGGYLLYSTCTFSPCEDEEVISDFLSSRADFSLCAVPESVVAATAPGVARPGVPAGVCRRYFPHTGGGEGQFMALLRRSSDAVGAGLDSGCDAAQTDRRGRAARPNGTGNGRAQARLSPTEKEETDAVRRFLADTLGEAAERLPAPVPHRGTYTLPPAVGLSPAVWQAAVRVGVPVGSVRKGRVVPHHHFFSAFGGLFAAKLALSASDPLVFRYLMGEEVPTDLPDGWACVTVDGYPLGGVKVSRGVAKNHYPTGLRNRR